MAKSSAAAGSTQERAAAEPSSGSSWFRPILTRTRAEAIRTYRARFGLPSRPKLRLSQLSWRSVVTRISYPADAGCARLTTTLAAAAWDEQQRSEWTPPGHLGDSAPRHGKE